MAFETRISLRATVVWSIAVGAVASASIAASGTGSAQGSGTFPSEPFNGLQIQYSVSGGALGPPTDTPGFTWTREQQGGLTGNSVTVSGSAHGTSGWSAELDVSVHASSGAQDSFHAEGARPFHQDFSVTIDFPPETDWVSYTIDITGDYNAGWRSVIVTGNLSRDYTPPATATPTVTPTPQVDLTVGEVEVTQLIQSMFPAEGDNRPDNSIGLVRGKRTALRVWPEVDAGTGPKPPNNQPVGARLELVGGKGGSVDPANQGLLWDKPHSELRKWRDTTINFHLPPDWTTSDSVTLKITINPDRSFPETDYDNNSKEVTLQLEERRKLRIRYFPVRLIHQGKPIGPDRAVIRKGQRIVQQWFPVKDNGITYLRGTRLTRWHEPFDVTAASPPWGQISKLAKWLDRLSAMPRLLGSDVDQYVGWIHMPQVAGAYWYGVSDPSWLNPPGNDRAVIIRSYGSAQYGLAHEIAHNYGRRHPNRADSCGAADAGTDWPYGTSTIQEFGYDIWAGGGRGALRPPSSFDLMSYCSDNRKWMSPHTYQELFDSLGPKAASAYQISAEPIELAVISGTVYKDGRAELDPLLRMVGFDDAPLPPSDGPFCVEFVSASSQVLGGKCFSVDFLDHDFHPADSEAFMFVMPFPDGSERIRVARSNSTVAEIRASGSAPELTVDSPIAGEIWAGPQTIRWTAQDADGDDLTFSLLYSHDGAMWIPLNADIPDTELEIDVNELPGGPAAVLKVLATDGFHTTAVDVAPLIVPAKGPRPVILEPEDGVVVGPRDPLILVAGGDDPEDGEIRDEAFAWSSDRDGQLGTGPSIDVPSLSLGTHVVTLTAEDQEGNRGSDTIIVHVRRRTLNLPLLAKSADFDAWPSAPTPKPVPSATRASTDELARQILALLNDIREGQGIAPLSEQQSLGEAAMWLSGDMAQSDYYAVDHIDRLGRDVAARVKAFGYGQEGYFAWRVAENMATGQATAQDVVDDWMASSPHRANILDRNLCDAGVGYAFGAGSQYEHYWVVDFGCRDTSAPTFRATSTPKATITPDVPPSPTGEPSRTPTQTSPVPSPTSTMEPLPGILGRVTRDGAPSPGLELELLSGGDPDWTVLTTDRTSPDGTYRFNPVPDLSPGHSYAVRYMNVAGDPNPGPGYLSMWFGDKIDSYSAGEAVSGGDFDVGDIPLVSPQNDATVQLPSSFCWTPRTGVDAAYQLVLFDQEYGHWESPLAGADGCLVLNDMPRDWPAGRAYIWWVRAYKWPSTPSRPFNFGESGTARTVTFVGSGASTPTTEPQGIFGQVTRDATPEPGLFLDLVRVVGDSDVVQSRTVTDAAGRYDFSGVPGLGFGEEYIVQYDNSIGRDNPGTDCLWDWYGNKITNYTAGTVLAGGSFDVIDIELSSPANEAVVPLPATFCWTPRGLPDDNYQLEIYDPIDERYGNTDYLGGSACVDVLALPPGWPSGRRYLWSVVIYKGELPDSTPHNYGNSQLARYATILATDLAGTEPGSGVQLVEAEVRHGDVEHSLARFERAVPARAISSRDLIAR